MFAFLVVGKIVAFFNTVDDATATVERYLTEYGIQGQLVPSDEVIHS